MKVFMFIFLFCFVLDGYGEEYNGGNRDKCKLAKCHVSLFQLASRPEFYHGAVVILKGIAATKGSTKAIYFDLNSYKYRIDVNGVYLNFGKNFESRAEILECKNVIVEGTFNGNSQGDSGAFIGELINISRIHPNILLDTNACEVSGSGKARTKS